MSTEVELLQYMFAGLVASWVFYGLTPYKRPTPFERVVQALVYTAIVHLLATGGAELFNAPNEASNPLVIFGLALAIGFFVACMSNNDWPHNWLSRFPPDWSWTKWMWKITRQSAHVSNLSRAFEMRKDEYVALLLRNGRRVYGWPLSWPDYPDEDYFILTDYEWLPEADGNAANSDGVAPKICRGTILIAAKDVDMIEFVPSEEKHYE